MDDFSAQIARSDSYYWNRANRAIAYGRLGDEQSARGDFDIALDQGGREDAGVWGYRAEFLLETGEDGEGMNNLVRAVALEPDGTEVLADLAEAQLARDNFSEARNLADKLIQIEDKNGRSQYRHIGLMLKTISIACLRGEFESTRKQFEETLKPDELSWSYKILDRWELKTQCPPSAKALAVRLISARKKLTGPSASPVR